MDTEKIDQIVRRRVEKQILQGDFSGISNIPYQMSYYSSQIQSLGEDIKSFSTGQQSGRGVSKYHQVYGKSIEEMKRRLQKAKQFYDLLGKHREGQNVAGDERISSQVQDDSSKLSVLDSQSVAAKEDAKLVKKMRDCLSLMKERQLKNQARKTVEHANLFGWQRMEHERTKAVAIAESIKLSKIDELLQAKSVAELTETTQMAQDVTKMEIDAGAGAALASDFDTEAWKYTD